jgi:steroid delta-isomerase-like uncharacterized protein
MGEPRELLESFGKAITGDSAALEKICTSDVDFRDSMQTVQGIPGLSQYLKSWSTAFPNAHVRIGNLVQSGDQAVGEMIYSGTHTGPMVGPQGEIPPTGRSVELHGAAWITIRDGKVARFNGYYDTMSMMVQLGLMPAPAVA